MSPYTVLLLCIQAYLIQSVMSQQNSCGCGSSSYKSSPVIIGYSSGSSNCGGYGGQGTGKVSATGTIGVCGETCVTGAVPVSGSVCFDGCLPACGTISVCGECGCVCQ